MLQMPIHILKLLRLLPFGKLEERFLTRSSFLNFFKQKHLLNVLFFLWVLKGILGGVITHPFLDDSLNELNIALLH